MEFDPIDGRSPMNPPQPEDWENKAQHRMSYYGECNCDSPDPAVHRPHCAAVKSTRQSLPLNLFVRQWIKFKMRHFRNLEAQYASKVATGHWDMQTSQDRVLMEYYGYCADECQSLLDADKRERDKINWRSRG